MWLLGGCSGLCRWQDVNVVAVALIAGVVDIVAAAVVVVVIVFEAVVVADVVVVAAVGS